MKRLLSLVLSFALIVTLLPVSALAAIDQGELDQHLSEELGWTQEELVEFLDDYGFTLEDFESIDELIASILLTEENLQYLLDEYGLTLESTE
ncbi:MAG: processed acidic surface protein [Bacillaceae bacterium]|nr:processed acidic surface protein [Bacillaceae bacterium]